MMRWLIWLSWAVLATMAFSSFGGEPRELALAPTDPILLAGRYYRVSLAFPTLDRTAIIEAAKQAGFSVRIAEGTRVSYFIGTTPCPDCTPENERSRLGFPQLYVDGALLWVRAEEALARYNLRPATDGYELIVAPKATASALAILGEIGVRLVQLKLLREPTLPLNVEQLSVVPGTKLPKPPDNVRLDSLLYGLMLMPDWYDFALQNRLELWGLRVRVIVELISPEAQLSAGHNLIVEARSPSGLMRVLVPVHQLAMLASDPAVKLVRPPFQPGN
ncbi:MAG: hypothetical protein NZ610_00420 [Candidatus Bipolaricaulota bacterium]|nr:hypothetical protein [Candidatus Bipolaricaulota bacterium]MCS7273863.1 hypothetical protein [Candidatus Bipolaricaulota bacterium]MDW8110719.1 hypothetical protein [Candidatus Bipolaricaulota bacterium]MDW8328423.1 hypothetical protein [Candidatus Bipolaricaulota bacterium]